MAEDLGFVPTTKPEDLGFVATEKAKSPEKKGFLSSLVDQVNPIPAIKEFVGRSGEIGKSVDALHILNKIHAEAAKDPANKGVPVNKWKLREPTEDERKVIETGMNSRLPSAEGNILSEVAQPGVTAVGQAREGDLAGAAGTLVGGYGVPAALPAVIKRAPAIRAAAGELLPKSKKLSAAAEAYRGKMAEVNAPAVAEPVPAPSTLDPQFHGPVAPVEPIAVPPPRFTYSTTTPPPEPIPAPPALIPEGTLDTRVLGPAKKIELGSKAPSRSTTPTREAQPKPLPEIPKDIPLKRAPMLPPEPIPAPRVPDGTTDPRSLSAPLKPTVTKSQEPLRSEPVSAPEKTRAPRPSDDFYKVHGQVRKAMKAAADLHSQGITAEQLQALSPAERAKALRGHSGETFERILFELRGLETGKITP